MEYRVRRTELPSGNVQFDFAEVATTQDGAPLDVGCDSVAPVGDTIEDLSRFLTALSMAMIKPVIDDKIVLEEWNVEGMLDDEANEEYRDRADWEKLYNSKEE